MPLRNISDYTQVWDQPWLNTCTPNGVYDACHQVYDEIMNVKVYQAGDPWWMAGTTPPHLADFMKMGG